MRPVLKRLAVAMACCSAAGWVSACSRAIAADAYFASGSATLAPAEVVRLNAFVDRVLDTGLPIYLISAVGYASQGEAGAKTLSRSRVEAVRRAMQEHGLANVGFDIASRGDTQPVTDNDTPEGRAKNRRVEIQPIMMWEGGKAARGYMPLWRQQFLALHGAKALVVARARVAQGDVTALALHQTAVDAGRSDLLQALMVPDSGLAVGATDAVSLLQRAAALGNLELVDQLLAQGVDVTTRAPLVATAGPHPEVLHRLLQAGADATIALPDGRTLFHSFKLRDAADVHWLQSLGLDINAIADDGTTPLHVALTYGSVPLLDAMFKAGAKVNESKRKLLATAALSTANQLWAIAHGASVANQPDLLVLLAGNAEKLPVLDAMMARGADIDEGAKGGQTPLAAAIEAYQPATVAHLLAAGVRTVWKQKSGDMSALKLAQGLRADSPPLCICGPCTPGPWTSESPQIKKDFITLFQGAAGLAP